MSDPKTPPVPGSAYKMIVSSADEAVRTIRERFGPSAKVLSVRQVEGQGIMGLFSKPKLEVVVQIPAEETEAEQQPQVKAKAQAKVRRPVVEAEDEIAPPLEEATRQKVMAEAEEAASQRPMLSTVEAKREASQTLSRSMAPEQLPSHDLPDLLRRSGFSEAFMAQLHNLPAWDRHYDRPLHATLADLGRELRLRLSARPVKPLPARAAFLGMRGSGRTTALCKWLGVEVFMKARRGRVLKVEFDQPNPTESLNVYCEALGIGMEHYAPDLDLSTQPGDFLYADIPGISLSQSAENSRLLRFLNASKIEGRVLVLNALYDLSVLRAAYAVGRDLGATHLVFTHCDEVLQWGKLMDFLIDGNLTPLFLATGPSLSGDCEEDPVGAALRKTIPGA